MRADVRTWAREQFGDEKPTVPMEEPDNWGFHYPVNVVIHGYITRHSTGRTPHPDALMDMPTAWLKDLALMDLIVHRQTSKELDEWLPS